LKVDRPLKISTGILASIFALAFLLHAITCKWWFDFSFELERFKEKWRQNYADHLTHGIAYLLAIFLALTLQNKVFSILAVIAVFLIARFVFNSKTRLKNSYWVGIIFLIPVSIWILPSLQEVSESTNLLEMKVRHGEVELKDQLPNQRKLLLLKIPYLLLIFGGLFFIRNRKFQTLVYRGWAKFLIDPEPETKSS